MFSDPCANSSVIVERVWRHLILSRKKLSLSELLYQWWQLIVSHRSQCFIGLILALPHLFLISFVCIIVCLLYTGAMVVLEPDPGNPQNWLDPKIFRCSFQVDQVEVPIAEQWPQCPASNHLGTTDRSEIVRCQERPPNRIWGEGFIWHPTRWLYDYSC